MTKRTGGQAIVEQLEREGVDVAFGMPGVHTLDIYDALIDSDVDHVTTRHEQGAGFMADGYARTTGRVGVALVITGPGLTNAATPIGQAYSDSSPMLVISSQNETNEDGRGKGYLHELKDQQGAMENIAAYSEQVTRVADIPDAVADAFTYLRTHRPRPVHIQIPTDVLAREERVELAPPGGEPSPEPLDESRIEVAVDRLAEAERPLLVVGGGASCAADAVRRLVDAAGVPVVSTVAGKGVVSADHPLSLGATTGREPVAEFVESRDFVLAIGTELSPQEFGSIDLPEALVQIDIDYRNLGKTYPTDLGIVADAAAAVPELSDRVESRGVEFGDDQRKAVADLLGRTETDPADRDGRHRILDTLRGALDDDAVVVNDMTKLSYAATSEFPVREPDTFLFPRGYGTLGFGPPAAFGAAVGLPDRQVVALVGDGGFLFTVQALATAVKYDLGVPVVVINDDCYGILEEIQARDYDGRTVGTDIENPEFVPLARAFGAAAERVNADEVETELPAALEEAFARDRPTVVEIPVDF